MLWDEPKIFFLERRYFFSIILSEFLKNRVALHEKNAIGRVQQLREKIEQINREIETAQQNYDLEKAAKLMYHRPANRGAQPPSGRQAAAL